MDRAFRPGMRAAAVTAAGLLLCQPGRASEGLESGSPGLENPPVAQDIQTPPVRRHRPLRRAKKVFLRGLARAVQPLLNYSRFHVSKLLPSSRHLPSHLAVRDHDDYMLPGFQWIPRGWNTFDWGQPTLMAGNQKSFLDGSPKPIGERGSFQISTYSQLPIPLCWVPLYFAFTLPNGVHFRLGARWDDIDAYVVAPSVALKWHVKPTPEPGPLASAEAPNDSALP